LQGYFSAPPIGKVFDTGQRGMPHGELANSETYNIWFYRPMWKGGQMDRGKTAGYLREIEIGVTGQKWSRKTDHGVGEGKTKE